MNVCLLPPDRTDRLGPLLRAPLRAWIAAAFIAALTRPVVSAPVAPVVRDQRGEQFPSHAIRMLVPFPPGASTDSIARIIREPIEGRLRSRVNIENRSGAGGNIGAEAVVRASADGHTWLIGTAGLLSINALLYSTMRFDPALDLSPLTLVARVPYVLVIHPSMPVTSFAALIEFVLRRPWILNYGSAGNGSTIHLGTELFKALTNTNIVHVPYRGGAPAISELMGGHIHMMFSSVPLAYPYVDSGRLRALVVTGRTRAIHLPSVPTVLEAGMPEMQFTGWFALLVPAKTPQRIIGWLNHEIVVALSSRDARSRLEAIGVEPTTSTSGRVYELMRRDTNRWQRVIRRAGIKPDWEDYPQ